MAYGQWGGRGRRRANPAAEARREREERERARIDRDRARFARLMKLFRRVELSGAAAQAAWGEKQVRTFTLSPTGSDGMTHTTTVRRGEDGTLYLQEPSFPSWRFSRLVPRYHVLKSDGSARDARRSRRRG